MERDQGVIVERDQGSYSGDQGVIVERDQGGYSGEGPGGL